MSRFRKAKAMASPMGGITEKGVSMSDEDEKADVAGSAADNPETAVQSVAAASEPEPDVDPSDGAESDGPADDVDESGANSQIESITPGKAGRRVSVSLRALVGAVIVLALIAGLGVMSWLYIGARADLKEDARQAADNGRAEQIALDYAVGAAKINYEDLNTWSTGLVKGATPDLKEKLSTAEKSMEQILIPLQWNSTALPLAAKVRSNVNGVYVVDAFVGVDTKTIQSPDGLQSTATYRITIDTGQDWQISEVGGIGSVVGQK